MDVCIFFVGRMIGGLLGVSRCFIYNFIIVVRMMNALTFKCVRAVNKRNREISRTQYARAAFPTVHKDNC